MSTSNTTPSSPKSRARHSFRDRIREVIELRLIKGQSTSVREILKEAGGGSASTVLDELASAKIETPGSRIGRGARSLDRIRALEDAINASASREETLKVENAALEKALSSSRSDVDKLLAQHQDSQNRLLQGVDDLRQMVRAGRGIPQPPPDSQQPSESRIDSGEVALWKARHDLLVGQLAVLEKKVRRYSSLLHEHGIEFE